MHKYRYLIIGGGMAADAAVKGIREIDVDGSIAMIGEESHPPYARPPLSKKLWQGKSLDSIWLGTEGFGVAMHRGRRAVALDAVGREVRDNHDEIYAYERLLLATGGSPRRLSFGGDEIIYFRTLDDYRRLRELSDEEGKMVVIGGGFIGSEIAAALAMNNREVTMLFPDSGIGSRVFPADLAAFVTGYYHEQGVEVLTGETVMEIVQHHSNQTVVCKSGRRILADGVVAGLGIKLNTNLAVQAGLPVGDGIEVDELLRAGAPDIFAAGDVASFLNPELGERVRLEHEDNAVSMGRQAGRNMAGAAEPYHYLPYFYSDLFELGYEAVGVVDSRLETVADWREPYRKGVIYYLLAGRVRGVLLWNVWDQLDEARGLISDPGPFRASDLMGRLPA
ncbi:MAG TPA: FAD-dependent oxidoreductase [Geobacteraceae bacterium]|nr:FAD-dependent oxidoreductase [Geobacteraceae bacterium]